MTGKSVSPSEISFCASSFAGTVMMENDHYVLKTSDNNTYQLDDQERAKEYEGKQVQVMGVLNSETNMIRVRDIKMAS